LFFNARVPQRPYPLGVTRACLRFLQVRRIRGVFLFGYFILDKQNKVTRQQGETMVSRIRQATQKTRDCRAIARNDDK